ncbi:hypothetical protein D9619_010456 [Psilocybe cf. subviscida]|uniref:Uncharacterized protein n=1 Tax=Psilocybe cf. subviscida TaxID=2480587 RepID=A0A8H5ERX8_9AGAR|nr:hypothetical protein D9619_010456 [Psilocybe cf. subviscida]
MFARACSTLSRFADVSSHWSIYSPNYSKRWPSPSRLFPFAQKHDVHSSAIPREYQMKRRLLTLNPSQLEYSGQAVLDLSNTVRARISTKGAHEAWNIPYVSSYNVAFPPHAQGVLYYHHPGEVRFRLCQNVQEFEQGNDLLLPNGRTWSISLAHAFSKSSESQRSAILDLISDERQSLSNWHILPGRHITTLSPANLSNQQVLDLSGCGEPIFYPGPSGNAFKMGYYHTISGGTGNHIPFPDGCLGVFYYKQSTFAPTCVGELRFRLCNNTSLFEQGTDLLLPTGKVWHITADQLLLVPKYRPLSDFLSTEGLLDRLLYPDTICNARVASGPIAPHLLNFSQPFIVDLARRCLTIQIWDGTRFERVLFNLPRNSDSKLGGKGAYSGRAVVRLEAPPQSLLDATSGYKNPPLFVLRYLEMLTPMEHNIECHDSSYMARPEPGQMLMKRHRGTLRPWTYTTFNDEVRQRILNFIQASSDVQA